MQLYRSSLLGSDLHSTCDCVQVSTPLLQMPEVVSLSGRIEYTQGRQGAVFEVEQGLVLPVVWRCWVRIPGTYRHKIDIGPGHRPEATILRTVACRAESAA